MKKSIKKIMMIVASVILCATSALAAATVCYSCDNDKPVRYDELPAGAKQFISEHFAGEQLSHATLDKDFLEKEYTVVFLSGTKLEFKGDGEWKKVDCRYSAVPAAVVPAEIARYVKDHYPNSQITELKREPMHWEAKITGGLELTFSSNYHLIDIDD